MFVLYYLDTHKIKVILLCYLSDDGVKKKMQYLLGLDQIKNRHLYFVIVFSKIFCVGSVLVNWYVR